MDEYMLMNNGFNADKIYMNKEGKYITLKKENDERKEFRYDLSNTYYEFERIRHFKRKDDEVDTINMRDPKDALKVTGWFANCTLVTDDPKFGKMYCMASAIDLKYRSPVRFIANFGHYRIQNLEKWLSYGIDFKKVNDMFNNLQHGRNLLQMRRYLTGMYMTTEPTDFDKEQLKYLRNMSNKLGGIDKDMLYRVQHNWNPQQYQLGKKLDKIIEDPRMNDAFTVTEFSYRGDKQTYNYLTHRRYGRDGRTEVLEVMSKWKLDPRAFCNYLLKLQHEAVDANDIMRNYDDYLQREYEMKGMKRSKMNKYPLNWMSYYHKHHFNYQAMKSLKRAMELEGKMEEYNKFKEDHKYLEYKDDQFLIRLPENVEDIATEATQQSHCLYDSYCEKILDGETIILFMRDVNHPDDSLVTVEVKYNGIEQARGHNNDDPTYIQQQWLLDWCKKKDLDQVIRQHY